MSELGAIREIEVMVYDALRGAPMRLLKEPELFANAMVHTLLIVQECIDDILKRHGITPLTGEQMEVVND